MRVSRLLPWFLTALMCVSVGAPRAWAADPDPRVMEEAAARYDRGVKLYEAGDFPGALAEFEAVYKLTGRYEVLFNIALTQKKLFRYGESVRTFERYLGEGGKDIDEGRRKAVEQELAEIRSLVAEVTVIVDGAPAHIEVDGRDEGDTPLDRPLLLGSGKHTIVASRDGQLSDRKVIEVVSGAKISVRLEPSDKPKTVTTAKVTIDSRPAGATLTIDGKDVGPAPWSGELEAGGHTVTASSRGHTKTTQEVVVVAGQERRVTIELIPLTPPPPPGKPIYKKWYFWAGVGAVVVGGAVGGYVILNQPESYDTVIHFP
jgi:hypothetical protein